MQRLIITGANGVGKSHLASRLAAVRPDVPVVRFDALKLRTGWAQRPHAAIEADLLAEIASDTWILEGGPSLLRLALARADGLVWLDPPEYLRAWRLARRPWTSLGKTRPEIPAGNVDWPLQQYRFALRSLRKGRRFRAEILDAFEGAAGLRKWRCRDARSLGPVVDHWAEGASRKA